MIGRLVEVDLKFLLLPYDLLDNLHKLFQIPQVRLRGEVDRVFRERAVWADGHPANVVGPEVASAVRAGTSPTTGRYPRL